MRFVRALIFVLLCVLLFICMLLPGALAADGRTVEDGGECGMTATWTLYSDGELLITGGGVTYDCDVTGVPWADHRSEIKSVTVTGVEYLGKFSFYGHRDDGTFYYYSNLQTVTIGSGVEIIGQYAFVECPALKSVTFESDLRVINDYAFCDNEALTEVTIPASVINVGYRAFYDCKNLKHVTVGAGTIEGGAFQNCDIRDLTLLNGVSTIGTCAFCKNASLDTVVLPATVSTVEKMAFYDDINIGRVYYSGTKAGKDNLMDNAGEYQGNLFFTEWVYAEHAGSCGEHASWQLSADGTLYIAGYGAMTDYSAPAEAPWYRYRNSIHEVRIDDDIVRIGDYAFMTCMNVNTVVLGKGLTQIGNYAFSYCGMEQITVGAGVNAIEAGAFGYCSNLKAVFYSGTENEWNNLRQHIKLNNSYLIEAHVYCKGRTWKILTLPAGTTEIGMEAFANTDAEIVIIPAECENIAADAFDDCAMLGIIVNFSSAAVNAPSGVLVMEGYPPNM